MKKEKFNSWTFVWALIDTFVRILTLTAVAVIIAKTIKNLGLALIILVFVIWAFRPMYLAFKESIEKLPKKKSANPKIDLSIKFLFYFLLFILSILIFFGLVLYLGALIHPLVLTFSFMLSAIMIIGYHHFSKKKFEGPFWSFSKFFFISALVLSISILFFSSYGLSKGTNPEPRNVSVDVYVVNDAIDQTALSSALDYSNNIWKEYNVSIIVNSIAYKKINLTTEEVLFLYDKGNNEEECKNYSIIIQKIEDNSSNLSLIFLKGSNSTHAGRGCLCNCNFALVSPEKFAFIDFTGWNIAHEIGHMLGLIDVPCYGRVRQNLMNDETKRLFFMNSDFLDQSQVDSVINSIRNKYD